jgi:hypothetical protein
LFFSRWFARTRTCDLPPQRSSPTRSCGRTRCQSPDLNSTKNSRTPRPESDNSNSNFLPNSSFRNRSVGWPDSRRDPRCQKTGRRRVRKRLRSRNRKVRLPSESSRNRNDFWSVGELRNRTRVFSKLNKLYFFLFLTKLVKSFFSFRKCLNFSVLCFCLQISVFFSFVN